MVDRRYALIGVEGYHDQAFIGRILHRLLGFNEFKGSKSDLDTLWSKFVPDNPFKFGKLHRRLDTPLVFDTEDVSVAIYVGEGDSLIRNLSNKLSDMDYSVLSAFGIVVDADKRDLNKVAENYRVGFKELFPNFPVKPGVLTEDFPRLGLYVLPDNTNQGVLETLILNCGKSVYPELMERAELYIEQFSQEETQKMCWKPFDKEKAIIATVVSVLKPGMTNTVSIKDDNWICSETVAAIPELNNVVSFLKKLLAIDTTSSSVL